LKSGTCIFVHKSINFYKININNYCLDHDIEASVVKLRMTKSYIYIFCIYRAPSGNVPIFFSPKLDSILNLYMNPNTEFIICGDMNIKYLVDIYRSQLNSLLVSCNLFNKVEFPIRLQNTAISVIDNIFIDFARQGNFVIFPMYNGFSDHDAKLIMIHCIGLCIKYIYKENQ